MGYGDKLSDIPADAEIVFRIVFNGGGIKFIGGKFSKIIEQIQLLWRNERVEVHEIITNNGNVKPFFDIEHKVKSHKYIDHIDTIIDAIIKASSYLNLMVETIDYDELYDYRDDIERKQPEPFPLITVDDIIVGNHTSFVILLT